MESRTGMYSLVQFLSDESFYAVPSIWIEKVDEKDLCSWLGKNIKNIRNLIVQALPSKPEWEKFEVDIQQLLELGSRMGDKQQHLLDTGKLPSFPLQSTKDLVGFEKDLSDTQVAEHFLQKVSLIGGYNFKNCVTRTLQSIFLNQLGTFCSWTGKGNNFAVRNMEVIKIIKHGVHKNYSTMTEREFELAAMEWFRHSKQRLLRQTNQENHYSLISNRHLRRIVKHHSSVQINGRDLTTTSSQAVNSTEVNSPKTDLVDESPHFSNTATNEIETQDETTLSQTDNEFPDSPAYPSTPATSPVPETPQVAKQYGGPPSRKRKVESNTNVTVRVSNVSAAIDKLDKFSEKNMSISVDEFDVFGKHIATQLRQLPLYNALLCEEQIEAVVRQQRLRLLN
ncbi:hypothetical protein FQR65_LT14033 [Abscondita terminalis]|nr:hypothetical protein FQR65_LT14033 [Abscondita terminalis]